MPGRFIYAGIADRVVHPRQQAIRLWEHWGKPNRLVPGRSYRILPLTAGTAVRVGCGAAVRARGRVTDTASPPRLVAEDEMNPLDPLDVAMMTAEFGVPNPMHVGTVLMLSPPRTRASYVEELYGEGARRKRIDRSQALRVIRIAV